MPTMKIDAARLLFAQQAAPGWRLAAPLTIFAVVAIVGIHWSTAHAMWRTWLASVAFNHGFLIVPISLWLVWQKRREVAVLLPRPDYLGLVLLAAAASAWLVGAAAQVVVVQQYALIVMVVAAVVTVAGRQVARELAFPLGFLLFAVPAGEALVPHLMDWTADATVSALRLTGIPVYQDGNSFSIPTGRWSVVEACSGLRYLIAALTVGTLFAYLNYRTLRKRLLFVAVSVAVPIAANFARAYLIVLIAHLSNMRLLVGMDHMIFGWVFFGVVIMVLFWLASFWRDPLADPVPAKGFSLEGQGPRGLTAAAAAVVAVATVAPVYSAYLDRAAAMAVAPVELRPLKGHAGWDRDPTELTAWRPHYGGAAASAFSVYRKGGDAVAIYIGYYRNQRQGAELVSSENSVVPIGTTWTSASEAHRTLALGSETSQVRETRLLSTQQRLLVWDWFWTSGTQTGNPYLAKALLARDRLLGRRDDSAVIVLAAPYTEDSGKSEEALKRFAKDMLPALQETLLAAQSGTAL